MRTAIILHGMPSKEEYLNSGERSPSNSHWIPWVQRQLIGNGVLAQTPELPEPYAPNYERWKNVFEQFPVNEDTILVGHSCGAGFLVRWLSETNVKVGKVALVAPWINPSSTIPQSGFFDFQIDKDAATRTKGIKLFVSLDDDQEELDTAKLLEESISGLQLQEFTDRGHFTLNHMETEEFPELFDYLIA